MYVKSIVLSLFVSTLFLACQSNNKEDKSKTQSEKIERTKEVYTENDSVKTLEVIKKVTVLSDYTDLRNEQSNRSKVWKTYEYKDVLDVVQIEEYWYGIKDVVKVQYYENEQYHYQDEYRIGWVLKSDVGSSEQLKINPEDLHSIVAADTGSGTEFFEETELVSFIKLEIIDSSEFYSNMNVRNDFITMNTPEVLIDTNQIILPAGDSTVVFKQILNPEYDDGRQEHSYEGYIEILNSYLIQTMYYEGMEYTLVDKSTGESKHSLIEYPHISEDGSKMICLTENPYEMSGELQLMNIEGDSLVAHKYFQFNKWMPRSDLPMFWVDDAFYFRGSAVDAFWNESGHFNSNPQFLRVFVLK
jgi:hypothetical protein